MIAAVVPATLVVLRPVEIGTGSMLQSVDVEDWNSRVRCYNKRVTR